MLAVNELVVTLPLPPSANALTRNAAGRGRVNTKAYVAWTEEARWHIDRAWRAAGKPMFTGPLQLMLFVGCDRRRDVSNCIKPVEDVLVKSVPGLPDDRWNDMVSAARDDASHGTVQVTVREMPTNSNKGRGQ